MNDHILLLIILSALVSLVFTFLSKTGFRERFKYFFFLFGSFVLLSIAAGWLMYPFPF